jgi:hypothetical protein
MKSKKSFLVPVVSALAAIAPNVNSAVTPQNTEQGQAQAQAFAKEKAIVKALGAEDKLVTYSTGGELHNLILRKNMDGVVFAEHRSHSSHSSHRSHASHYSSR